MEDIFCDWKPNLVDAHEQRKQAAINARKHRTRKISNRALRKELVKEIEEAEKKKPMSYSDILKKNLKAPMEDIFEAWRDYLQELDEIVRNDSGTSFCKGESVESILEDWFHNFEGPKMDKQDSNKMLKNKQRNQRRSKKNNKQQQYAVYFIMLSVF